MSQIAVTLPGIARTCDKIESVLSRKVIDLKKCFESLDEKKCGLISEQKFFTVLYEKLGCEIGLCQEEVRELSDYLKKEDGRIDYRELVNLVTPQDFCKKPYVTGLEWEDPEHVNVISSFEMRHLNLILTKIGYLCRLREIQLEGLFGDYEIFSHNNGTITIAHFRRILYNAGVTLTSKEFQILVNRYNRHGYTVNYLAFLTTIRGLNKWFDEHPEWFEPNSEWFVGIDTLPRPKIDHVDLAGTFGREKACHPCLNQRKPRDTKFEELMMRIKKYVLDNRIRTKEFFEKFDASRSGLITTSKFRRGLEAMGLSGLSRLYVAEHDLEKIFNAYKDNWDDYVELIKWKKFCDDVDVVFTAKCLEKNPYTIFQLPPEDVKQIPRPGTADWETSPKPLKDLAQEVVFRLRNIIKSRRIQIDTFFKGYDKIKNFHITRCQVRRVFSANSILLSDQELQALMLRYGDDMGFNYHKFLEEIDDIEFCEAKHQEIMRLLKIINEQKPEPCSNPDFSIIDVLAKIKNQVKRNRINIDQFFRDGERLDSDIIPASKFRASFSAAGIFLENCELDIICASCKSHRKPGFVNHKHFCDLINKVFLQTKLESQPHVQPRQHIPCPDDSLNFLNFDERCIVSRALQKLSRHHDGKSNMKSFFEDRASKSGIVTKNVLERVLMTCGLSELLTEMEVEVLFKCFSHGSSEKNRIFDYKNFLMVLSRINEM